MADLLLAVVEVVVDLLVSSWLWKRQCNVMVVDLLMMIVLVVMAEVGTYMYMHYHGDG